ncbi:tyrosine-type recombinase/integrase [Paenibacillus glacialis]|uniref:Tyr recombinase domain-containing protein n=1 Tax=Paenibacillus glacialis TaxID=494026 RepID=A0A168KJH6_9BACL|nr:tyrosine-type recombinase/integrase [Paenibacillus glacialis]OAB42105.1 hypothetical protein PGLA_13620 [Paenibacillus glacialis]
MLAYSFKYYLAVRLLLQISVLRHFDRFAERVNIVDEKGEYFHFTVYAFRHRFGINLTKNGLNMVQVHQLLANVTSEMTMTYAKITHKLKLENNH